MPDQTKIKSIRIENVRGISSKTIVFDTPEMIGNKFHLLLAPNGFGKSSLATAFASLTAGGMSLPYSEQHNYDEAKKPRLIIEYSVNDVEHRAQADATSNDIFSSFSVSVIRSRLVPIVEPRVGVSQYQTRYASIILPPITLVENVPTLPHRRLTHSQFKKDFGKNGKILPRIDRFLENKSVLDRLLLLPEITEFKDEAVWLKIDVIRAEINERNGTSEELLTWIERNEVTALHAIPELRAVANVVAAFDDLTEMERYLVAYQFAKFYADDLETLKRLQDWCSYTEAKAQCANLLQSVNSNPAWINVRIKETGGRLVANFPLATTMSNGQRDLLSFVAQLMKAEFGLTGTRAILVVDEVFDYLDECNLLAAQFYCSRFIETFKAKGAEVFPMILTHLDPDVFKHSVLGLGRKDGRRIHQLDKASDSSRKVGIAAMIRHRENPKLKPCIGKYFFHYHPKRCNRTSLFKSVGLKESWGKSRDFYSYVWGELRKYVAGESELDFVAACVGARLAIEKHAFDQLSPGQQVRFTDEFKKSTSDKLDFVEDVGVKVPLSHRLLGLLYNDILHHKENFDYISAIVSKMKNSAIRGMISEIQIPENP